MRKFLFLTLAFVFTTTNVVAEELPPLPKGPMILTSATRAMQSPDFWIRKIPNAEAVIKTPRQLDQFNDYIRSFVRENVDIFKRFRAPASRS